MLNRAFLSATARLLSPPSTPLLPLLFFCMLPQARAELRAGAANVDISPTQLPAIQNGGFLEALIDRVVDPLHARAIALDDGREKVAIVVVDSCMVPRDLCDQAKALAHAETGIAVDRILISATHTHSAPSAMDYCLGSRSDPAYTAMLPGKIAEAITSAHSRLQPARVGFAAVDAGHYTKNRRWIRRSDRLATDPFGERTVHAMMHPGYQNPDFIGPSGPVDPWLSLLSIQTTAGRPLALLANFSMHYFGGHPGASADYYGRFARAMQGRLAPGEDDFVAMMSQGTSGDLWWGDYAQPEARQWDIVAYTNGLARLAEEALQGIDYDGDAAVAMAETRITLERRLPDEKRLEWARAMVAEMSGNRPRNQPEVYAEQALWIHEHPREEVVLQALRIGNVAVTGMPNEVYAITGLKLKARSPLPDTFNMSLANGAAGYIPPPEQHLLGGYNTWPARTAGLEVGAEPKIVEALLEILGGLGGENAGQRVATSREAADNLESGQVYFDMADLGSTPAYTRRDGATVAGAFAGTGKVAFAVPGIPAPDRTWPRAMGFAGGKFTAAPGSVPPTLGGSDSSVEFWFWNGLPNNSRDITGYLYSNGTHALGISGTAATGPGRLFFANELGRTEIMPRAWNHVILTSTQSGEVRIYLNGDPEAEISAHRPLNPTEDLPFTLAADRDDTANFEGRIDEVSVFNRVFTPREVAERFRSFGIAPPARPEWGSAREPQPEQPDTVALESPPLSPEATVAATHVADGYVLELVAAEPEVADPVAIDWGPDGRLWVAEMADYPYGMDGQGKPGGRVRYLEDRDGDGRYETSTLFVDGLRFPTSVMPWRDGVLITAAPDLLFANDPDGDGTAQVKVLFNGFVQGNQQLRVNSLRWGLDNWVYCASGGHHVGFGADTVITNARGETVELGSRDFRFRPDTGALDPQSGPSQFGRVRDDFGNWFGVQNSWPLWHYVLADHYLRRNPSFAAPDPRIQVRTPGNPRVFPNKAIQKRFHSYEQAGRYTSACGPCIYRDNILFPDEDNVLTAFTCEPFHNVVQRHRVERDGSSFKGDRADDGSLDFFASGDRWCRPVMSRTGPDGALYVVDMYRYMIEHPDWLPPNGREELKPFYRSGDDRGRIYRIRRDGAPGRKVPMLAEAATDILVQALAHRNGSVRDQAHRLLIERGPQEQSATSALETMAARHQDARARLHALCVLDGWNQLPEQILDGATADRSPDVRRHAARIAEPRAGASKALASAVVKLTGDPDASVRLQAILALGEIDGANAGNGLVAAAMAPANEGAHFRTAVMTAAPRHLQALAGALAQLPEALTGPLLALALQQRTHLAAMLNAIDPQSDRGTNLTAQFFAALDAQDLRWGDLTKAPRDALLHNALEVVPRALASARATAGNPAAPHERRLAALQLLGRDQDTLAADLALLERLLLDTDEKPAARNGALIRLLDLPHAADAVFSQWQSLTPDLRSSLLEHALRRKPLTLELLAKVENGSIPAVTIPLERRQQLHGSSDADIKTAARRTLGEELPDRSSAVAEALQQLRGLQGDPAAGASTFTARCAVCHLASEANGQSRLGPDLRALTDHSSEGLLASIIDPSRAVDPIYAGSTLTLASGDVLFGLIKSETGAGVILQLLDGTTRRIARDTLSSIEAAPASLMPPGLDSGLTPQQIADLLEHVRTLKQ